MCVIVVKPQGEHLTRQMFRDLWVQNPDGGGMSVFDGETLIVHKTMDRNELWRVWRSYQERLNNPEMVMHLRIATHGTINTDNCHPFPLATDTNAVLYHNGILACSIPPGKDDARSDTRYFVEEQLSRLPAGWWNDAALFDLVESAAHGNRLLIHTPDGVFRFNAHLWVTRDGLKLSNDRGLFKTVKTTTTAKPSETTTAKKPWYQEKPFLPAVNDSADKWNEWLNAETSDDDDGLVAWWAEQNRREIQTLIDNGEYDALDDLIDRDLGMTFDEVIDDIDNVLAFAPPKRRGAWTS